VAFGAIVTSLVQGIIMPIGPVTGGLDFSNCSLPLSSAVQDEAPYAGAKKQGAVVGYGQFITVPLNFLIVAWALFLVIRAMNKLKRQEDARADVLQAPEIPAGGTLLSEIRDLLATGQGTGGANIKSMRGSRRFRSPTFSDQPRTRPFRISLHTRG
jgi:large conductance mechanosensitive channel